MQIDFNKPINRIFTILRKNFHMHEPTRKKENIINTTQIRQKFFEGKRR